MTQVDDTLWHSGLYECCSAGVCTCLASTFGCCHCVNSYAISLMDGSSFCFNCCCINPAFARLYVRTVYGIRGRPGWDVCTALCPCTAQCSACQIASHVTRKGPAPHWPPTNSQLSLPRHGCSSEAYPSVCSDPCAMVLTCLTSPCTRASQGASITGLPFWAHFFCSSFSLDNHLTRVNYGLPGSDLWLDCLEPCCYRFLIHAVPGIGTLYCCYYTAQTLENHHQLINQATMQGAPKLMLNTEVTIELPQVTVVRDQPRSFSVC